jgi:hypothetical protein
VTKDQLHQEVRWLFLNQYIFSSNSCFFRRRRQRFFRKDAVIKRLRSSIEPDKLNHFKPI